MILSIVRAAGDARVYVQERAMPDIVYGDYEWDEQKDKINRRKHQLAFSNAIDVFERLHIIMPARGNGERRWKAVGLVSGYETTVIFTERNERKRIISARRSGRRERKAFHVALAQAYD